MFRESVRVLSDAIKRQVKRNAQLGHDVLQEKTEAYAANEQLHAENLSQQLEGFSTQLQQTEAAAEAAEKKIDEERLRHAAAKKQIAETAEKEMNKLQEEEAEAVQQQHHAEANIRRGEAKLKKEEAELNNARKQHQRAKKEEEKHKHKIKEMIEKEREREREEEEAQEAREESIQDARVSFARC
ncbi:uncharacterized protein EMH_0017050 [Eimeria mitis]|uniref:Uncharacterized protein n=1 Tax=Eimeria mitis TaxID=44415 RepID=U6KBQ2_9EIME|nr:uncharacterized protein EMH_0017050 [Eimeria mitis]CDJ33677.1 hypothetical protein, conserved [Eimeria mitis]